MGVKDPRIRMTSNIGEVDPAVRSLLFLVMLLIIKV